MAVTQRDVAARAGVSPAVVSRVLFNRENTVRVSEATAKRVLQAARDLDYRLNVSAKNFRRQETQTIGILHGLDFARLNFDGDSHYFAALMDGIVDSAFDHEYAVTLCPRLLGRDRADAMGDGRFDGLVWYSASQTETSSRLISTCPVPLVTIHSYATESGRAGVICDNAQGIGLALDHLFELGHRKIAFAYESYLNNSETWMREAEFRSQTADRGFPVTDSDLLDVSWSRDEIDGYLDSGPRHTAMFCHNEVLASQFLVAAQRRGIRIPEQLSLVGFDSTSYCEQFRPKITCVSQPLREIGKAAIHLLVGLIKGEENPTRQVVLPCGFDVRESTGPCPEGP